jgi:hypothetical protein
VATPTLYNCMLACFLRIILDKKIAFLKGVLFDNLYMFDYSILFGWVVLPAVVLMLLK